MKDQIYILENFTKEELIKLEKLVYKKTSDLKKWIIYIPTLYYSFLK